MHLDDIVWYVECCIKRKHGILTDYGQDLHEYVDTKLKPYVQCRCVWEFDSPMCVMLFAD